MASDKLLISGIIGYLDYVLLPALGILSSSPSTPFGGGGRFSGLT